MAQGLPSFQASAVENSRTASSSRAKEEAMSFEIEFEEIPARRRSLGLIVACALALVGGLALWRTLT